MQRIADAPPSLFHDRISAPRLGSSDGHGQAAARVIFVQCCFSPVILIILVVLGLPALAMGEATRLYEEARALVEQAEAAERSVDALSLLDRARANLDAIVERHSASETASRLILGDPLQRRLNVAATAARELAETEHPDAEALAQSCFQQPTADCLFDVAVATAHGIQVAHNRLLRLGQIAAAQAKSGRVDAAMVTARRIDELFHRASALGQIAAAQAEAGQFDAAMFTTRGIENAGLRAEALREIAAALAKAGQLDASTRAFDDALSAAGAISNARSRASALGRIAAAQAEAGQLHAATLIFDDALAIARAITNANIRALELGRIAAAQAGSGQLDAASQTFDDALIIAYGIENAGLRAGALREIAAALAKTGQLDAATRALDDALTVARGIEDASRRASALGQIAGAQAEAGQFDAALAIAWGIDELFHRGSALGQIAAAQAEAGQFDAAMVAARGIEDAHSRAEALREIAVAQAEARQLTAALTIARGIKDAGVRANALAQIALSLVTTDAPLAPQRYILLSQKSPANYHDPSFRDLLSTTASGDRPVWQLACLAAVYTMLERGRGNENAMIDDWFADPREHGGQSPGAIGPAYVGGNVAFDAAKLATELDAGRPVILRAVGGPLGQHFVLAVAVEGDGEGRTVQALDPWPGQDAADDAPGHVLQLPLVAAPAHPLIPALTFTHMRSVSE